MPRHKHYMVCLKPIIIAVAWRQYAVFCLYPLEVMVEDKLWEWQSEWYHVNVHINIQKVLIGLMHE